MATSSSHPTLLLLLLLMLLVVVSKPLHALSLPPKTAKALITTTTSTISSKSSGISKQSSTLILPLKKQAVAATRKGPNKLLFHHNVSLTVTLSVGTPPQNVSLVLDTGSELTWLRCNSSSASPHFRPSASASYSSLPCSSPFCTSRARDLPVPAACDSSRRCHVSISYADASSSEGSLSTDAFLVGQSPPLPTVFGCMDSAYSSSGEDALTAGFLGMNRGALSFPTQSDIRKFSYCISDIDSSGVLLIGGESSPSLLPLVPPLNYTPLVEISLPLPYFDRVAYSVQLEGIHVGDTLLPIPKSVLVPDHTGAGQTMVDSGTQFTFLLGPAYAALKSEFLRRTGRAGLRALGDPDFVFQGAFDACFLVREGAAPPRGLPEVRLAFRGGAEVRVAGERLLYRAPGERRGPDGVWCLTFGNSDLVPMEAYVIGHHHQQNVWVEYDLENRRVGFAPVQCDLASRRLGLDL
ncbi:aspartic proteinase PCS1 [Iris pallida]|uniref:Aspartic proteinase PCS1 n=1 Tax=Iris pallida TaxID=29817 RepID=A0AAX6EY20_IRIPA|nr:aspartic proteinase PCS1 [Iris pallida]KAJ6845984.1 aspartic proteinase PCS1 [Iris pallida]